MTNHSSQAATVSGLLFAAHKLIACCTLLMLVACSDAEQSENRSTLERIQESGSIRVGYANEAPYAYMDSATGKVSGEAPTILRVIMKSMGVDRIEAVLTEFGALIPGLKAGRFDIIAAGMYITPARCKEIAFSEPTYGIGEALLVPAGNPLDLHSYEDIAQHEEARLGVVAGTVELGYARASRIPDERIIVLPDNPSAVAAVRADRIDAFAGTALTVQDLLAKLPGDELERASPFTDPVIDGSTVRGYGAFGFRRQDTALHDAFNKHLKAFTGSAQHLSLVQPFGFTEAELPGQVSAEELCRD